MEAADKAAEGYVGSQDKSALVDASTGLERPMEDSAGHAGEEIFNKGTSRRIWGELYKVVDASDVLVFVLDARDPMGTRCLQLERELRRRQKHVVLLLNKVDLVPTWVTRRWVQELMKEFPTLAFHASITNPFGKNSLLNLLRQFGNLLKDKKHVTIGMVGYPNVGKSSVINTLKRKTVCKAAPVPGETRVWQYIALTRKLYLLDCPGIVPPSPSDFEADCAKVLKGVVRAERLKTPSDYIHEVLQRVKKPYLLQRYKLAPDTTWNDSEEFLTILGKKMGKLVKGGDADIDTTARIVLYDWQRGRIPYFTAPPETEEDDGGAAGATASASVSGPAGPAGHVPTEAAISEIPCVHVFDEEDRRGEAAPTAPAAPAEAEGKEAPDDADDADDADAETRKRPAPEAEAERRPKKARKRKARKTRPAATTAPGPEPGSLDWKAVVAEFGI